MKSISVKGQIILLVTVIILLSTSICMFFIVKSEKAKIEHKIYNSIQSSAEREAAEISGLLNILLEKSRLQSVIFSNAIEHRSMSSKRAKSVIKEIVGSDTTLYSASVLLEQNYFDISLNEYKKPDQITNNDLYSAWWYWDKKILKFEEVPNFISDVYYTEKNDDGAALLGPYAYILENGQTQLFISAVYPINANNRVLGATYSDMSLKYISEKVNAINVFTGDYTALLTSDGLYATHPNNALVGKSSKTLPGSIETDKRQTRLSDYLNRNVYDFYVPVAIAPTNTSWYLRVSTPTEIIDNQLLKFKRNLYAVILSVSLVILLALYIALNYALKPISKISKRIIRLSKIDVDRAEPLEKRSNDEIGKLYDSYNSLLHSLKEKRKIEIELEEYQSKLEFKVKERTEEYLAVNEELNSANEELNTLNEELSSINNEYLALNNKLNTKNLELEEALKQLKETQSQLIQSDKMASIGVLTAGIAHELNNPLNYIQGGFVGLNKIIDSKLKEQKPLFEKMLNAIQTGIERTTGIISGLNQFNRNNKDRDEICDLNVIIDNCLLILNNQLKNKITLTRKQLSKQSNVKGNIGELHQVFLNIISNAEQAIPEKGTIDIVIDQKEKNLLIEIADNGSGIKEENLQEIMQPFFTTKPPGKGTGLGLSITEKIIKDHKGELKISSKINEGTTIHITLPSII